MRIYNSCVEQTKNFVSDCGFSDVVIGLSGGIDSSLCAVIAKDALGAEHVHGVILPGPFSSKGSEKDAKALAENLGIDIKTVSIDNPYTTCVKTLNKTIVDSDSENISDLTSQNIQARLRMIMIMAISNENNWLMLNTANKSEVYTGYSTLYGDMAGAYAPIGSIYKCDVFKMCVAINMRERRMFENKSDLIPQNIIDKPPSAELTKNQTDEKSLDIDYATLDAILHEAIDNNKSAQDIVFLGFNPKDVQNVFTKIKKSAFKRPYEPPSPKI